MPVAQLPPAVSLETPAGTVMVFDGRLLHGTGINQTDTERHVMVMAAQKPWMRTQDLHTITVAPDVLAEAPLKLLQRLHFVGKSSMRSFHMTHQSRFHSGCHLGSVYHRKG
eukprot:COSAG06_NODE_2854_length_6170_cov_10.221216_5_plen_111_part_00